jgi:hypothetical protein
MVKKKLEREKERREKTIKREFFPFFSRKREKRANVWHFFLYSFYPASLLYSTRSAEQKRRDFETTERERVRRWCSFCPAMVALFHPRRRVLFYHHQ